MGSNRKGHKGNKGLRDLSKAPTGIQGLDEITGGGLPRGRPTLVCGNAGCGKTLLGMEFLVRGATDHGEPGVFMSFEETEGELTTNVASLGFDLDRLRAEGKLLLDHVHVERSEIEETGEYDLEGLFIRLNDAFQTVGAKRVVLDTIESLFAGLPNPLVLRSELRRLFRWLKDRGVTAIITGERGESGQLTRQGLEEYVSDCVIVLDHRVHDQVSTRRLRVVKYRGSHHGTNEYPFLIDETGISVLPITSLGLDHVVMDERISTGIPRLDAMLGGEGLFRGSSVLISGTAGTGKTSVVANMASAACSRGERVLYFAFEESPQQIFRNMRSIGVELEPWARKGLLRAVSGRPLTHGLEMHLVHMHKEISQFKPSLVVIDPFNAFVSRGNDLEVKAMLVRLVDFLKSAGITAVCTSLTSAGGPAEASEVDISSLIDTWILLRSIEINGERNRGIWVLKSRGMPHSNQIREYLISDHGVELLDVYVGSGGVLTGSARVAEEAREAELEIERRQEAERKRGQFELKRQVLEAQIATLRAELESERQQTEKLVAQDEQWLSRKEASRSIMGQLRKADRAQPASSRASRNKRQNIAAMRERNR